MENRLKVECEQKLAQAMDKNVALVDEFLATEKGKNLVMNRTEAYLKVNEGIILFLPNTDLVTV